MSWSALASTWDSVGSTWRSILWAPVPENTSNLRVELGLQKAFLLDDEIAGVIGNTEYVLDGEDFIDITPYAYNVSSSRGKNTELDKYRAGSLSVQLHNQTRFFDPNFIDSPFYGNIVPRRGIRFLSNSVPVFTGKVSDWNLSYKPGDEATAEVYGIDQFSQFATQQLTPGTVVSQSTGQRISAVLNMASVDWPVDDRRIDTGQSTLGSAVVDSENALTYLQEVELSEIGGSLFMSREGYLVFKDRTAIPQAESKALFSDAGDGILFVANEVEYGTENLYNQITVTSPAGTAIANDLISQESYGVIPNSFDTFLSSQEQLDAAANFLVNRYSQPLLRFKNISVDLANLTETQKNTLYELELADIAEIKITPNNIGDPVQEYALIIGITHNVTPNSHEMQFAFAPVQENIFIIGDAEFGIIGVDAPGVLGY